MSRIARCLAVLLGSAAALAAVPVQAQVAAPPTTTPAPATPQATPPGNTQEQAKTGVITPPAQVDPSMRRAAPPASQAFPMPVVRPPGTPGGNPNVIAK